MGPARIQLEVGAVVLAVLCAPIAALADAPDPLGPMSPYQGEAGSSRGVSARAAPQLAVAQLNGRELNSDIPVIAQPDGGTLVALEYLLNALSLRAEHDGAGYRVETPIGTAVLPASALHDVQGYVYVDTVTLSKAFASDVRFDASEYALRIDTTWNAEETKQPAAGMPMPLLEADVRAPFASVSQVRSEIDFTRDDNAHHAFMTTDLGGAIGAGYWRARYNDDLEQTRRFDTWSWVTGSGDRRWLLGRQIVSLNSLLPTFYLTGAQIAASNRPSVAFGPTLGYGELAASRFDAPRSVRGKGPPGGIAELRRSGQVIARTTIRLDGSYEFTDQVLGGQLEIAVYERGHSDVPLRVEEVNTQAADQMLPAGAWLQQAGLGSTANPLDPDSNETSRPAGFYQWRQGVTNTVTTLFALQTVGDHRNAMAGAAIAVPGLGAWAAFAARGEDGNAWQVFGDGGRGHAFWRGNFQHFDAGFLTADSTPRDDYNAEAGWTFGSSLRASLVGRHYRDSTSEPVDFVKPALAWQPNPNIGVSARPDFEGRYTFYASWAPLPDWRVAVTRYNPRTDLEIEHRYAQGYGVRAMLTEDSKLGRRAALVADGWGIGGRRIGWSAGLLAGEGRVGYLLDAAGEIYPGLSLHAQYLDDPLMHNAQPDPGAVLTLALVADFAITPSGLARGSFRPELLNVGGISGRIAIPGGAFDAERVVGTGILVDGRIRGEVDANGRFYLADLAPGVYTLELDTEKLPLEYQPSNRARRVEVKAGAVTRIDFPVTLSLGIAGRVSDGAGHGYANAPVSVVDEAGRTVAETHSDAWGYYRVDGLPPASYRVSSTVAATPVTRTFTLRDRFLFGQDLIAANQEQGHRHE